MPPRASQPDSASPQRSFELPLARARRALTAASIASILAATLGCGMAAAPQPPSLQLPKPVSDLEAQRFGNQVILRWQTPRQTTDRLTMHQPVRLQICRQTGPVGPCSTVATLAAPPGKPAQWTDVLPAALATGPLRDITYRVIGVNKHGRSAGPSNGAQVLAGTAPPEVTGLTATVEQRGVVLHWTPAAGLQPDTFLQLERTLLPAESAAKKPAPGNAPPAAGQAAQVLVVAANGNAGAAADPGVALDSSVQFDQTYRYIAARVTQKRIAGTVLRASSPPSQPMTIFVQDRFPPGPPQRLAAIPVSAAMNAGRSEIDLSWSPSAETDFAQYRVYRQDITAHGPMLRIAPEDASQQTLVAPAYRDLDVVPGHQYLYSVSAVDADGNESMRSAAVEAAVPAAPAQP